MKPVLAITIGDPAGIGPEVVLKSLTFKEIYHHCSPLVIGDAQILSLKNYGVSLKIRPILNPLEAKYKRGVIDVLHVPSDDFNKFKFGQPNAATGAVSAFCVKKSVELALNKLARGVVHAPISKLAWKLAGVRFPGHTEMIAEECGIKKFAMAIAAEPLRTVLATRHIPLKEVSKTLNRSAIIDAIFLALAWMKQKKISKPKIGVCALNPHAGERGLLGKEEIEIIAPAIREVQSKIPALIDGPLPADSAFKDHKQKKYDCLVTLYHDQSLIPLKLFSAEKLVNITLGLGFPRTSPGHGTAFDIAGKKRADPRPMLEAILTAAKLTCFLFFLIFLSGCRAHLDETPRSEKKQPLGVDQRIVQEQSSFQTYESLHFKIRGTEYQKMVLTANLCEELYGKIMFDTNLLSFKPRENYLLTIYPTREEYHLKTGYPEWSGGGAITQNLGQILPEEENQRQRITIVTFEEMAQAPLLAHELCHLIFNEFMGFTHPEDINVVLWVNEGLASYEELAAYEKEEKEEYLKIVGTQLKQNLYSLEELIAIVPMRQKLRWVGAYDYRGKTFVYSNIDLWYWQARSVVSFLIEKGGNYNFFLFLNSLKQNKDLAQALRDAYPGKWKNPLELDFEWRNSF